MAVLKVKNGTDWVPVVASEPPINKVQTPKAWVSSGADSYGQPLKVLDSFGVSSVVFQTVHTRVNFSTPLNTTQYACIGTVRENDTTSNILTLIFRDDLIRTEHASYIVCRRNYSVAAWTDNISIGISASFYETGDN